MASTRLPKRRYGMHRFAPTKGFRAASTHGSSRTTFSLKCWTCTSPLSRREEFPPFRLLTKLGGLRELKLAAQDQITSRRPEDAERIMAFLELYDGTGKVENLQANLREAFGIPDIPGIGAAAATVAPVVEREAQPKPAPRSISPQDRAIETWVGNGVLDQNVANALRPAIFSAVSEAIDWDMLALEKAVFAGRTGKPFQSSSIGFERHPTAIPAYAQVKLLLPANTLTGLALPGWLGK